MTTFDRFRELHARDQLFLLPNPWDLGSAKILAALGFEALATTSAGFALAIGKTDQTVMRDELVAHVAELAAATALPLNVDSERLYPDDPGGVAETVGMLADAGAAGCSIEDYDPETGRIDDPGAAAERVGIAAEASRGRLVLTARAENHLYAAGDLDDTIARLVAYRDAGADVVYAPGLTELGAIRRVVESVGVPVNVLALRAGPSVGELAKAGVRRVSTGSGFARAAYGAFVAAAEELLDSGTSEYAAQNLSSDRSDTMLEP